MMSVSSEGAEFLLESRQGLSKKVHSVNQATDLSRQQTCWIFLMNCSASRPKQVNSVFRSHRVCGISYKHMNGLRQVPSKCC